MNWARFKKYIKSLFSNPKRNLWVVMPEIRTLKKSLDKCKLAYGGPRIESERFYGALIRWHDRNGVNDLIRLFEAVNYGQYNEVVADLRRLQKYFDETATPGFTLEEEGGMGCELRNYSSRMVLAIQKLERSMHPTIG